MCSTHAFLAPDEHRCTSGSFRMTPHTPTMEEMSMPIKSQLMMLQMVFLPWECVQLCSYTDVNYLNLDLCETRDIFSLKLKRFSGLMKEAPSTIWADSILDTTIYKTFYVNSKMSRSKTPHRDNLTLRKGAKRNTVKEKKWTEPARSV